MGASPERRRARSAARGRVASVPDLDGVTDSELWARYKERRAPDAREALLLRYLPLVTFAADRVGAGSPASVRERSSATPCNECSSRHTISAASRSS